MATTKVQARKRRKVRHGATCELDLRNYRPCNDSAESEDLPHSSPSILPTVWVEGEVFNRLPVSIPMDEHVRNIRLMPMREDDVIVAAFPKSGTHWLWEMVQMVTTGRAQYDSRSKLHATIEFHDVSDLHALPAPRVLNSHLYLRHLSNEIAAKRSRVIHVLRNPKDLCVSYYFHLRQLSSFVDRGFHEFAVSFINGDQSHGVYLDYFTYVQEMELWQQQHPEVPTLNIFYEDAKKDPVQCVRQLAHFLQCHDVSEDHCTAIAQACSFPELKAADFAFKCRDRPGKHLFKTGQPDLFRKGEVGDWKNHFTMALSETFDQVVAERLKDCNVSFQYFI